MQRKLNKLLLGLALCHLSIAAGMAAPGTQKELGDVLLQQTEATHFIWTDKLWYQSGDTQVLRWTFDPQNDPYPVTVFVYRENIRTGERMYVSNGALSADVRDAFGNGPGDFLPLRPTATTATQLISTSVPAAAGNYQYVAELRDVTATQIVKKAWAKFNVAGDTVTLGEGGADTEISSDVTWTSSTVYRLRHQVFVNGGATLTIEPGTLVLAAGQNAVIVVERGGRLVAEGTRELPIVMTCDDDLGARQSGCWAGLIMLGRATTNFAGEPLAEGVIPATRPLYGGMDDDDDSGVLKYVRVEFAGVDFTDQIQPNAFGFHGIGRGTSLCYIQAHEGEDDGIEFFGGTANMKYWVSEGSKDDSLDSALGWRGFAQYGFIIQDGVEADSGYEGDGNEDGFTNMPFTDPKIWNVTLVGQQIGGRGIRVRRGHQGTWNNNIVLNFQNDGYENSDTSSGSAMNGNLFWLNRNMTTLETQLDEGLAAVNAGRGNIAANPLLRNVRLEGNPDPRPREGSPALAIGGALTPPYVAGGTACGDGAVDNRGSFRGGFGANDNWLEEWTFFGPEDNYDADPTNDTITPAP